MLPLWETKTTSQVKLVLGGTEQSTHQKPPTSRWPTKENRFEKYFVMTLDPQSVETCHMAYSYFSAFKEFVNIFVKDFIYLFILENKPIQLSLALKN